MFFLKRKKGGNGAPPQTIEYINRTSASILIEELQVWYPWDLEETRALVAKCESVAQIAELYVTASVSLAKMESIGFVPDYRSERLELIHDHFSGALETMLKQPVLMEIKQLHKFVRRYNNWSKSHIFKEREALAHRLEGIWRKLSLDRYNLLSEDPASTEANYMELYEHCMPNDSLRDEISKILAEIRKYETAHA